MPYGNISAVLSDADRDKILADLNEVMGLLPFLVNITPDEMQALPKMGEKSVSFVDKSLDYSEKNPNLVPPYLNVPELRKDLGLTKQLLPIYGALTKLFGAFEGTYVAVGSECMVASLSFYNTVRDAAKRNVPGARAIYEDLRTRFPGRPPTKAEPPAQ